MSGVFRIIAIHACIFRRHPVNDGGPYMLPIIWPQQIADDIHSPTTTRPTLLQVDPKHHYAVGITVIFTLTYRVTRQNPWAATGSQYILRATGPSGTVIQNRPSPTPQSGVLTTVSGFRIVTPHTPTIAFSDRGAWTWQMISVPAVSGPGPEIGHHINHQRPTCLELYFIIDMMDALFWDEGRGIDVRMLRMMYPAVNIIYDGGRVNRTAVYREIVVRTWNHGSDRAGSLLQYDVYDGSIHFKGKRDALDRFRLNKWFLRDEVHKCNCVDLAHFVSIVCRAFGYYHSDHVIRPGGQFLYSTDDFGFIRPSVLFGWPNYPNCNNPFWAGSHTNPIVRPDDSERTSFSLHMWNEVPDPWEADAFTVLDATLSVGPAPAGLAMGTQSVRDYVLATTDGGFDHPWPDNVQDTMDSYYWRPEIFALVDY